MVAVRFLVRIGKGTSLTPYSVFSGKPSEVYSKCLQEVQTISCATLFAPVLRVEAVQAMSALLFTLWSCPQQDLTQIVLVSGWSDNGWLSGGHAVRMALELCKSL